MGAVKDYRQRTPCDLNSPRLLLRLSANRHVPCVCVCGCLRVQICAFFACGAMCPCLRHVCQRLARMSSCRWTKEEFRVAAIVCVRTFACVCQLVCFETNEKTKQGGLTATQLCESAAAAAPARVAQSDDLIYPQQPRNPSASSPHPQIDLNPHAKKAAAAFSRLSWWHTEGGKGE